MVDFMFLWLRGLVFTVTFIMLVAMAYGAITFMIAVPQIGVPVAILIMPIFFGLLTEVK